MTIRRATGARWRAALVPALALALAAASAAGAASAAQEAGPGPSAKAVFAEAERLRFAEDWYSAIEAYLSAIAKNPSYGEALESLAECYYELGEYDQALSYARRAAPFLRDDPGLADLEGFIRLGSGDLDGARRAFEGVLAGRPNDLDARFGLALLDLAAGRRTEARVRLQESLGLSPQNARALLSLALIASDQGRGAEARSLIEKALRYHGSEPRTQYVAARLAAADGDPARAAFHARNALDLKPSYGEARILLGSLMYESGSFDQAIAVMREAVARDRKDGMAWYTLGLAQAGAAKPADAIYSFKTAAGLRPDDEIVRIALEDAVMGSSPVEDASREPYADWHFKRGREFQDRSLNDQALFEYRRGLRIYPYSSGGRMLYAELLGARGFPGKYLSELRFLREGGKAGREILDSIEIYDSLLADAVGRSWGVDEQALPKRPYKLALMYAGPGTGSLHPAGGAYLIRYLRDILSSSSRASILDVGPRAASLAEAYRRAREAGADYFVLLASKETERDIEISAELRVGRTGSLATSYNAYRTGNDRVKNGCIRLAELLASSLPAKGNILRRSQNLVLVDLGKVDGMAVGSRLSVLKNGSVRTKSEGLGLSFVARDQLGEIELTRIGEEASEGRLKISGFFDTVNIGDEAVLAPSGAAAPPGPAATGTAPGAAPRPAQKAPAPQAAQGGTAAPTSSGLFSIVRKLR